jgi:pimeloyl-ACP methyl ester carboxylesterase
MIPFIHSFQYNLESDFTFVHWDQRNTGKTFKLSDPDSVLKTLSLERSVEDAYELTQYIKQKLKKEKIVIIGHSWGSVLGTALVLKYPEEYPF